MLQRQSKLVTRAMNTERHATDAAWEADDAAMEQLLTDCYDAYEAELTTEEQLAFWKNALRYMVQRYGASALRELRDPRSQEALIRAYRARTERLQGDIEAQLRDLLEEGSPLDDLLKGIGNEVNRFLERIEQGEQQ